MPVPVPVPVPDERVTCTLIIGRKRIRGQPLTLPIQTGVEPCCIRESGRAEDEVRVPMEDGRKGSRIPS